jgi:beta-galactosidase
MSGANTGTRFYWPQPGCYDFDAPVSECGDLTWKYELTKRVIEKYRSDIPHYDVKNNTKVAYGKIIFTEGVSLFDALPDITQVHLVNAQPVTFEALNQDHGIVLYGTNLANGGILDLGSVHDRATVMLNRKVLATVEVWKEYNVTLPTGGRLDVMVHHQGREDTSRWGFQYKGLVGEVKLNGTMIAQWEHHGFNLNDISRIKFTKNLPESNPAFFRATFDIEGEPEDTFLNPTGWVLGNAFINGYHLQRYWTIGPQLTIYIPKCLLVKGKNELVIFEHEKVPADKWMTLDDHPQIDIIP